MSVRKSSKKAVLPAGAGMPAIEAGMRIGLFGGSFDPPHEGHLEVSFVGLRRLGLDQVWWLVSPQNPLKRHVPSNDLSRRVEAAREIARHPAIRVTAIEAEFGTRTTAETLDRLLPRLRKAKPVWMMGADNLASFHHWGSWESIAARLPIAVFNRPGKMLSALASPAAHRLSSARISPENGHKLADLRPPAWVFLPRPYIPISSTEIRNRGGDIASAS